MGDSPLANRAPRPVTGSAGGRFDPAPDVRALATRVEVTTNLDDGPDEDADPDRTFDREAGSATFWHAHHVPDLRWALRQAVAAALIETGTARDGVGYGLGVLLASDGEVARLNADWRGRDTPTNVLSWPGEALGPGDPAPAYLGDLAFAYATVEREADERGESVHDYLVVLAVHGIAHCLGHDHPDAREAARMERLEARILARLGLPDPYAGTEPED